MKRWMVALVAFLAVGTPGFSKHKKKTEIKEERAPVMHVKVEKPKKNDEFNSNINYFAVIKVQEKGEIKVLLNTKNAPRSCTNFIMLAKKGFYNGLTFHRVEPGFVIQGGDPLGTGTGGPGYTINAEVGLLKHTDGAIAWASRGDVRQSSGSQFYICDGAQPLLDNKYGVFGQTFQGMDVVRKISVGDVMDDVSIVEEAK